MDKIFDDSDFSMVRFPCNCLHPYHSLDVYIEKDEDTGRLIECNFTLNMNGKGPLRWRIKEAWGLLRGKDTDADCLGLRDNDIPELIKFLKTALSKTSQKGS